MTLRERKIPGKDFLDPTEGIRLLWTFIVVIAVAAVALHQTTGSRAGSKPRSNASAIIASQHR